MKLINNSAVEFFSTFCPSFYEKKKKKKKKTRETIVCACLYFRKITRCTDKFCPSRVILITRGRRKKTFVSIEFRSTKKCHITSYRAVVGTAMERRSRFSKCRRHEWGGGGGGWGGGVREVDDPSC